MKSKASTPRVDQPVRGSRSGRPVMVVLDLLGRRSTLRLLWELRDGQALTFRALQQAADTNPGVLNTRLAELRESNLVGHDGEGYRLTPWGHELVEALGPLSAWSDRWAAAQRRAARKQAAA